MKTLARIALAASIAIIGSIGSLAGPAQANTGDTPIEGYPIPEIWSYNGSGALDPGAQAWFRIGYPGGGMGITLHVQPEYESYLGSLVANVNVRMSDDLGGGERNVDYDRLVRIGRLGQTENTGPYRLFWFQDKGDPQDVFLLVRNNSGLRVPFVLSTDWRSEPAAYVRPFPAPGSGTVFMRMGGSGDVVPYFWTSTSLVNAGGDQIGWANVEQLGSGALNVEMGVWGVAPGAYAVRVRTNGTCDAADFGSSGDLVGVSGALPALMLGAEEPTYYLVAEPVEDGPFPTSAMGADGSAVVVYALEDEELGAPVACGALTRAAE